MIIHIIIATSLRLLSASCNAQIVHDTPVMLTAIGFYFSHVGSNDIPIILKELATNLMLKSSTSQLCGTFIRTH